MNKEETLDKKIKLRSKKIKAIVNYSKPSRKLTSITYCENGNKYSTFVDGIYDGEIEIEYFGDSFDNKNIIKIK